MRWRITCGDDRDVRSPIVSGIGSRPTFFDVLDTINTPQELRKPTFGQRLFKMFSLVRMESQNERDVRVALEMGFAAGQVVGSPAADPNGSDLRIAFDFDGVLADDSSERVMQTDGLPATMTSPSESSTRRLRRSTSRSTDSRR